MKNPEVLMIGYAECYFKSALEWVKLKMSFFLSESRGSSSSSNSSTGGFSTVPSPSFERTFSKGFMSSISWTKFCAHKSLVLTFGPET